VGWPGRLPSAVAMRSESGNERVIPRVLARAGSGPLVRWPRPGYECFRLAVHYLGVCCSLSAAGVSPGPLACLSTVATVHFKLQPLAL
jgi:hypothetical protein